MPLLYAPARYPSRKTGTESKEYGPGIPDFTPIISVIREEKILSEMWSGADLDIP
jgi:hypothetical protein